MARVFRSLCPLILLMVATSQKPNVGQCDVDAGDGTSMLAMSSVLHAAEVRNHAADDAAEASGGGSLDNDATVVGAPLTTEVSAPETARVQVVVGHKDLTDFGRGIAPSEVIRWQDRIADITALKTDAEAERQKELDARVLAGGDQNPNGHVFSVKLDAEFLQVGGNESAEVKEKN